MNLLTFENFPMLSRESLNHYDFGPMKAFDKDFEMADLSTRNDDA